MNNNYQTISSGKWWHWLLCLIFVVGGLLWFLSCAGCGGIEVYTSDGHLVAREFSVLKNVGFKKFATTAPSGKTEITSGTAAIDDAAIEKIIEGVVAGLVKGAK